MGNAQDIGRNTACKLHRVAHDHIGLPGLRQHEQVWHHQGWEEGCEDVPERRERRFAIRQLTFHVGLKGSKFSRMPIVSRWKARKASTSHRAAVGRGSGEGDLVTTLLQRLCETV